MKISANPSTEQVYVVACLFFFHVISSYRRPTCLLDTSNMLFSRTESEHLGAYKWYIVQWLSVDVNMYTSYTSSMVNELDNCILEAKVVCS